MSDNCSCCNGSTESISKNINELKSKFTQETAPELISPADDTFNIGKTQKLTESA